MKRIIGNWKANKTYDEADEWCSSFISLIEKDNEVTTFLKEGTIEAIICPPYPFVSLLSTRLAALPNVAIGVQSVSSFKTGAYTGEVTAMTLQNQITYAIVGHSERRSYFNESNEDIALKVALCKEYGIEPIVCIRGENDSIPSDVSLVAFEPVSAIGTGQNMPASEVVATRNRLQIDSSIEFFYGGSVNETSAAEYTKENDIQGLLVGGASLKPDSFFEILRQVGRTAPPM